MASPRFAHQSAVSQAGFTMIPNAVMLRGDLSPTAKLIYGYLKHLAWRDHGDVAAPAVDTIAADLKLSERTVRDTIRALEKAPLAEGGDGQLVESKRRGLGLTNAYVIHDPADLSDIAEDASERTPERTTGSADIAGLEVPFLPVPARARSLPGSRSRRKDKSKPSGAIAPVTDGPPRACRIDGRNLPLDALVEVCKIGGEGDVTPRATMALVYLNGPKGHPDLGIRTIFWAEVKAWAESRGEAELARLNALTSEEFERALAARIHQKAAVFHEKMPGVTMGPKALRDWWFDIEKARASGAGGRVTADEFADEFRAAMRDVA